MERITVGWNEDLDLNAGAAAIAAMKGQDQLRKLVGTDQIQINNEEGAYLKRISWHDETPPGSGGYLTISGRARKIYFGKLKTYDVGSGEIVFPDNNGLGIYLPKNTKLDCIGNASGTGAEQHSVLLDLLRPDIKEVNKVPLETIKRSYLIGLKTGTLVAATLTGDSDVLGQTNAYEDSETSFGEDPDKEWCLIGIIPLGAAGYGVMGVKHQNNVVDRVWPSLLGTVSTKVRYIDDLNPKPEYGWKFSAAAAPTLKGSGVGTTSIEAGILIGEL